MGSEEESLEGARAAFAKAKPLVERAAHVLTSEGLAVDPAQLVATVEREFLTRGRLTYTGTTPLELWLGAMLPRFALPATSACPGADALVGQALSGQLVPHVKECRVCTLGARTVTWLRAGSRRSATIADRESRPSGTSGRTATATSDRQAGTSATRADERATRATRPSRRLGSVSSRVKVPVTPATRRNGVLLAGAAGAVLLAAVVFVGAQRPSATAGTPSPDETPTPTVPTVSPATTPTRVGPPPPPRPPTPKPPVEPQETPVVEEPPPPPPPTVVEEPPTPGPQPAPVPGAPVTPPPPPVPAEGITTRVEQPELTFRVVWGDWTVTKKDGSSAKVAAGDLKVAPEDRLTGSGGVSVGGVSLTLDEAKLGGRARGADNVVTLDKGSAVVDATSSKNTVVSLPNDVTVRPEGRVAVETDATTTGLTVLEGRAVLTTRSRTATVKTGERAQVNATGLLGPRKATTAELEKARAAARRPIFTLCAGSPTGYKISTGATSDEDKTIPCPRRRCFVSRKPTGHGLVLILDKARAVPAEGTFQFSYRAAGHFVMLSLVFDRGGGGTHTFLLPSGKEWQTLSLPVSPAARRFGGDAGLVNVVAIHFWGWEPFSVDEISFTADTQGARTDGYRERLLLSVRNDRTPKTPGTVESIVGKNVMPLELRAGRFIPSRLGGPEGNGSIGADESGLIKLGPKTPLRLELVDGVLGVRWIQRLAKGEPAPLKLTVEFANPKDNLEIAGFHAIVASRWGTFEQSSNPKAKELDLTGVKVELGPEATAEQRAGFELDELELYTVTR